MSVIYLRTAEGGIFWRAGREAALELFSPGGLQVDSPHHDLLSHVEKC